MTARLFEEQITLAEGMLVRVRGLRGQFRALAPCKDGRGAWWFRTVDCSGVWCGNDRVFHPSQCRPARRSR